MSSIKELGEFNLIRHLASISSPQIHPPVIAGIGDDAAVYRPAPGMVQVVTTDAFIEGHHFDLDFYEMYDVGYKAMAVNLSDIAAMNARPTLATVALGVPSSCSAENLSDIYKGLAHVASRNGVQIVGGDTTRSPVLMLSITVIAEAPESAVAYRSGAKPGHSLCLSGHVGGAAIGLDLMRNKVGPDTVGGGDWRLFACFHLRPAPRLDLVREWARSGVFPSAMIDVSDGLSSEIHHICRASNCGAVLWESNIPLPPDDYTGFPGLRDTLDYALHGGDDYELLFTAPQELVSHMYPEAFTEIGVITEKDVLIQREDGTLEPLKAGGHDHFRLPS